MVAEFPSVEEEEVDVEELALSGVMDWGFLIDFWLFPALFVATVGVWEESTDNFVVVVVEDANTELVTGGLSSVIIRSRNAASSSVGRRIFSWGTVSPLARSFQHSRLARQPSSRGFRRLLT